MIPNRGSSGVGWASGNTWAAASPLPSARYDLAAVAGPDGRIYALGGMDSQDAVLNTVQVYDPTTNSWSATPALPTARAALAAVVANGLLYAIGGVDATGQAGGVTPVRWRV